MNTLNLSWMTPDKIEIFFLVLLRVVGFIMLTPIFGRRNIPTIMRVGFCLVLTIILMNILPIKNDIASQNIFIYTFACIKEILFGIMLGYIITITFTIVIIAGQIMDMQIGFSMSQIFDPQLAMQVPMMGNFLNTLLILLFLATDGHHYLIKIVFESFQSIEPGHISINLSLVHLITQTFILAFILAIKLAIPIIAVAVLTDSALGIIVRTVPQMNVFVVGMPLKVVISMVALMFLIPIYAGFANGLFEQMFQWINKFIQGMIGT